MLTVEQVDLSGLAEAMESHGYESSWWLDPVTGAVEYWSDDVDSEDGHPEERGLVYVEPLASWESYQDLEEFAGLVSDPRAAERLGRAIQGKGAFRRFKDEIWDLGLRDAWFTFHGDRMMRRAVDWLIAQRLVSQQEAERYLAQHPPPQQPELSGVFDVDAFAQRVAADLRDLYGERLARVLLFGSWSRGEAAEDSDVDLLVILRGAVDVVAERFQVADMLWRHSREVGRLVSAVFVSDEDASRASTPFLARVTAEGREVS